MDFVYNMANQDTDQLREEIVRKKHMLTNMETEWKGKIIKYHL